MSTSPQRRSSTRLSAARSSAVDYSHLERRLQQPGAQYIQTGGEVVVAAARGKRRKTARDVVPSSACSSSDLIGVILKLSGIRKGRVEQLTDVTPIEDLVRQLDDNEGVQMEGLSIPPNFLSDDAVKMRSSEVEVLVDKLPDSVVEEIVISMEKLSRSSLRKVRIVTLETTAILIHRVGGFVMESVIIPRLGDIAAVVREAALVVLVKSLAAETLSEEQLSKGKRAVYDCLVNEPESAVRAAGINALAVALTTDGVSSLLHECRDEWCSLLLDCCYDATLRVQIAAGGLLERLFDIDEELAAQESSFMSNPLRLWWLLWDNSASPKLQESIARIVSKHILADDIINNSVEVNDAWRSLKAFIEAYSPFRDDDGNVDVNKLGANPTGRAVAPFVRLAPQTLNTISCWHWAKTYLLMETRSVDDDEECTHLDRSIMLDMLRTVAQTEIKEKGKASQLPPFELKALCEKFSDAPEGLSSSLAIAAATTRSRIDKITAFRVCFHRLEQFYAVAPRSR